MSQSFIQLPVDSSGKKVDTQVTAIAAQHRQVFTIGDPSTDAGVAPVSGTKGLAVDLTASGSNTNAFKVDGSAVTQPVSAASLPLPTGASTAAKQPTLGIAGTASSDVISIQGVASMTAVKTDGSATTQPISGTITANAGTNLNTSALALETGGNLAAIKADTDKIPSQGQALAAASMPVVLTAAQVTTLTPPAAITNYANETGGNLATIATDVAPLVASGAGGYVRQDSTATIAKESGGNLAAIKTDLDTIAGTVSGGKVLTTETNSSTIATNTGNSATSANQTNGNQQTKITDGTNIANVLKSDGTAAGQNAQIIGGTYLSQSFSITSVTTSTAVDVGNYCWVSVYIATQYTGSTPTITWQGSNDNTNWVGFSLLQPLSTLSSGSLSTTVSGVMFAGPINFRYFRLNFTGAYSSGTAAGTVIFSTLPRQTVNINGQVSINGTQAINTTSATGSAVPANAFYIGGISSGNLTAIGVDTSAADSSSNSKNMFDTLAYAESYNGTTWDRLRNNTTGAVIAAGATSTNAGVNFTTYNASKAVIILNVSAFTSGTITVTVNGVTSSGYTYPILVSAAIGATGVTPLRIFPGSTPSANAVANDMVPRTLQVVVTGTFSLTYGIDYELSV